MNLILALMISLSLPCFGQGSVQVLEGPEPVVEVPPVDAGEDSDEVIEKLQAERKKQMEAAVQLDQTRQNIEQQAIDVAAELKKLGYDTFTAASMMDEKVVGLAQKVFRASHMENSRPEDVKNLILMKASGTKFGAFLMGNPKVMEFIVDVMRDREALPSLLGIFLRKSDLKIYFYVWLAVLILSFLVKKYAFPKKWKGFKRFSMAVALSLGCTCITLGTFYFMFQKEVTPLGQVIVRHLV